MKKGFLALLVTSMVLLQACTPASAPSGDDAASSGDVVNIGFVEPLTGDIASIGQDIKLVVEMFFEENPLIADKKVEVVYEDGKCNGQTAASAAQKLINVDGVKIILGGGCSGETLGIAPIADKNKVLTYTTVSSSPEISGISRYVFRGTPSDDVSSVVLADEIAKIAKKVALVTQNNDYSQAYRQELQKKLPERGVEIVVDEAFNSGTTDFKSVLQKVKNSEAEILINIPGEASPGGFVTKQARELGIDLPIYGGDVLSGDEYFEVAKDAAEGTTIVITAADRSRADVDDFLKKFEAKKGSGSSAEAYMLLTWDQLNILKQAIESVGWDVEQIVDYLENMEPYKGLGGVHNFDENHDANILPNVMVAKDGKFVVRK